TLLEVLRGGVERLAELHDVDATLTKRRTDRGRRRGRTRGNLKLELACNFLSHFSSAFVCAGAPHLGKEPAVAVGGAEPGDRQSRPSSHLVDETGHGTRFAPFPQNGKDPGSALLDLTEFQIDRHRATENRHLDLE